jgi:thiamine-monophosphate kinase
MTKASFSEDELVAAFRKMSGSPGGSPSGVKVGIGDDAAVVESSAGDVVLTTDAMVEGAHFERTDLSARDLGYKAIVASVSDIAAMAASPRYALASLIFPKDTPLGWIVELYGGMREACEEYALALVGGDLSSGGVVALAVTVTGAVAPGHAVLRSGARAGDRLVVTGSLGAAAGGLMLLHAAEAKKAVGGAASRDLVAAFTRPVARVGEARLLASFGATAMMDLSDGLAKDAARLCRESGVAARIHVSDVPVAPGLRDVPGADPRALALSGGEDYELLATMPPDMVATAAVELKEQFAVPLTEIGEVAQGEGVTAVEGDGSEHPLAPEGWDHFA